MPSLKNFFYYDEEKCEFIRAVHDKTDHILCTISLWIVHGFVLASIVLVCLTNIAGTPAELALKAENDALVREFQSAKNSIESLESKISDIAAIDNEIYRSVLGLDPIRASERGERTGGADPYTDFDLYSEDASEILRWTASRLNSLERQINVQHLSFEEIKEYYNENRERLSHIPAIKPVNGVVLSSYGVRVHPVFSYSRMHEGIDFRADVGTPVYATGNAVVKKTGLQGTYGSVISLDHGFGYETFYAHLSGYAEGIQPGVNVERGDLLGYSGRTGVVSGPHLHYEVHYNDQAVDPMRYLFADTTPEEYMMYQDEMTQSGLHSMD